ncbi:MAG: alpha/beta fold hydrolase [Legionellaceae bacterium]|nr:alpha/beta fold hydrolase [Legionellaceae bacterium]
MNINDFNFMWRGKVVRPLDQNEISLLSPIDINRKESGRALLLLHGFASSPAIYRELLPTFTMYDAIVCPVLAGHADSIDAFAKSTANDWLETVIHAGQLLAKRYETVDVMGLSLGGLLACKLSEYMTINHLYLLAPALVLCGPTRVLLTCAQVLRKLGLKRITNHAGNFHIKGHAELTYRQLPLKAIIEILTYVSTNQFKLPRCPTDLFLGRYDEVVDSSAVARLFANDLNTKIHWLNNSAHILPLDGDIEAIVDCVKRNIE